MLDVIDQAQILGYVDGQRGYKTKGGARRSWFRPTEKMRCLLNGADIEQDIIKRPVELLLLKDATKTPISYSESPIIVEMKNNLDVLNKHMQSFDFSLCLPAERTYQYSMMPELYADTHGYSDHLIQRVMDFLLQHQLWPRPGAPPGHLLYGLNSLVTYRRVFNRSSWTAGGRFYCDVQNMPKALRQNIRIDGNPTAVLDFGALHIKMLYALKGIDYQSDPYVIDLPGWRDKKALRAALKKTAVTLINARTHDEALKSLRHEQCKRRTLTLEPGFKCADLLVAFASAHPRIADAFCSDAGIHLIYQDSQLAASILSQFVALKRPIIGIHDGFLVDAADVEVLRHAMTSAYVDLFGFLPAIKLEL